MKNRFATLLIYVVTITFGSCGDHDKTVVALRQTGDQSAVIYRTQTADFIFERNELIEYCKKENDGEPNNFTCPQIIEYITKFDGNPVVIPDIPGTKMVVENEVKFNQSDSLIRIRDQNHPYAYMTDDIRWAVIEFSRRGQLRIYHHESKEFIDTIIVDDVTTFWYGETNITLTNNSIIFSQLRWIK